MINQSELFVYVYAKWQILRFGMHNKKNSNFLIQISQLVRKFIESSEIWIWFLESFTECVELQIQWNKRSNNINANTSSNSDWETNINEKDSYYNICRRWKNTGAFPFKFWEKLSAL